MAKPATRPAAHAQRPEPPRTYGDLAEQLGLPQMPDEIAGVPSADMTEEQRAHLDLLMADRFMWLCSKLRIIAERNRDPLTRDNFRARQQAAHDCVAILGIAVNDLFASHDGQALGMPRPLREIIDALATLKLGKSHPLLARNSEQFDADETELRSSFVKAYCAAVVQHLVEIDQQTDRKAAERVAAKLAKTSFSTAEAHSGATSFETIRGWHKRAKAGDPQRQRLAAHYQSLIGKFRAARTSPDEALNGLDLATAMF